MKTRSFFAILLLVSQCAWTQTIIETQRGIPVAFDVDVVVVGGASSGVAAASAAARAGAKVFLAAPRPYLGEDLCATWRMQLESGEEPSDDLARAIFQTDDSDTPPSGPRLPFTYESDTPSSDPHKDTIPTSLLSDGDNGNAYKTSVQFGGNTTIIADLGAQKSVGAVRAALFQRHDDIGVKSMEITISADKSQWSEPLAVRNNCADYGEYLDAPILLSSSISSPARYVRFHFVKSPVAKRMLIGELIIEAKSEQSSNKAARLKRPPTPMQVKLALDETLDKAGVAYLHECYATDVLRDADGRVAGIVMANSSGRQAVLAKVIVDATPRSIIARLSGAEFEAYPSGPTKFLRVTLGAPAKANLDAHALPVPFIADKNSSTELPGVEYSLEIPMRDASFASFANAEQMARDMTWDPAQKGASETLFQVPPDKIHSTKPLEGPWPGVASFDLGALRPANGDALFVLGGCADMPRDAAERLLRPVNAIALGTCVGAAAAQEALNAPTLKQPKVAASISPGATPTDLRETLNGIRSFPSEAASIESPERSLPILGAYDVVVVGGGTGGAPAGIAAARRGAKTLVLEYLDGLGGVSTLGLIGKYYYGYRKGFTEEIDKGVAKLGGSGEMNNGSAWNVEWKMEWFRKELRKAGADIWFETMACGVTMDGNRVTGVVAATPLGRGVVTAKVVIDATGNANAASDAGALCVTTDETDIAVQGAGMPPRAPGASYTNTDYTITDDSDAVDKWRTFVSGRDKFRDAFDLAQIVDSRERRRVVGDFAMSPMDIWNHRTYPDTVALSTSNFDTHGYTVHPFFFIQPPSKDQYEAFMPYRCFLPKNINGLLVIGLGVSAHRDAMPILRMQPDIQNHGYAMGVAAAMSASSGKALRDIDLKALQKRLVEIGNLPETVLTDKDSYPVSQEDIARAVESIAHNYDGASIVFAFPEQALPLLRNAYNNAKEESAKLKYAHVLGIFGDGTGTKTITEAVAETAWDNGWSMTGMGQYGASVSPLDSLIIALGKTRGAGALTPILKKASELTPESDFSHFRAIALACESIADKQAAPTLANILSTPKISGHVCKDIESAKSAARNPNPNIDREIALRELLIARALYRCGDKNELGKKTLEDYQQDLRGHIARHAHFILAAQNETSTK
jgi:flavin-dependent dehydrogenase